MKRRSFFSVLGAFVAAPLAWVNQVPDITIIDLWECSRGIGSQRLVKENGLMRMEIMDHTRTWRICWYDTA